MASVTDFSSGIGVNTHVDATDTAYGDVALITNALAYLGVDLIRDHAYSIDLPAYQALAQAGIKFDLIADSSDPRAELDAMAPVAGNVVSLEGANEVDVYPVENATGSDIVSPAIAEQQLLYGEAKADPLFANTPVLGESIGDPSNFATFAQAVASSDVANVHAYAGSDPPLQTLQSTIAAEAIVPGQPIEVTETGYYTLPSDPNGVDETVQAKFTLDTLFDDTLLGVANTFLYELFDEAPDPNGTDSELHYGLFNADGTPKLAATALHNLTSVLALTPPAGEAPLAIAPSVSGLPASGNWLQLTAANGPAVVAVWAEPGIWDSGAAQEAPATPADVTVHLGATASSVSVYDPMLGTAPIATYANISQLTVTVTDHPLIIEAAAAAPTPIVSSPGNSTPGYATANVYRFFDSASGTHFYTDSASELASIEATRPDLVYEGVGFGAVDPAHGDPNAAPVYRFFDTTYGTHFFTDSLTERDAVMATRPDLTYEGIGFYEHATAQEGDVPVYRFFDSSTGTHFYTASASEDAGIIASRPDLVSEGIGFYAPT